MIKDILPLSNPQHIFTRYYIDRDQLKNLDPITVLFFDFKDSGGNIMLECYGKAWSSWFHGMGKQTAEQFFMSCSNDYLMSKFDCVRKSDETYLRRILEATKNALSSDPAQREKDKGAV